MDIHKVELVVRSPEPEDLNVGSFYQNDEVRPAISSSGHRPRLGFIGRLDTSYGPPIYRSVSVKFCQGRNRRGQLNSFLADLHGQIQDHLKKEAPELLMSEG